MGLHVREENNLANPGVEIVEVRPSSIAEELGIKKGDRLISINGARIKDILEIKGGSDIDLIREAKSKGMI